MSSDLIWALIPKLIKLYHTLNWFFKVSKLTDVHFSILYITITNILWFFPPQLINNIKENISCISKSHWSYILTGLTSEGTQYEELTLKYAANTKYHIIIF